MNLASSRSLLTADKSKQSHALAGRVGGSFSVTAATTLVARAIATGPGALVMKRRETLSLARDNACLLLRTGNGAVPPFREIVGLRRAASDLDWRRNREYLLTASCLLELESWSGGHHAKLFCWVVANVVGIYWL